MKNGETGSFRSLYKRACVLFGLEDLNAEAVQLAATIRRNFEELGI